MIQELLGASSKIPINGTILQATPTSSPSPSPSSSSSSTTTTTKNSSNPENLRCPRCDSSNTKFCYYNNYNLTQPRHFCKTCRRYWTKGGALRNVPIGGGCRKNRSTTTSVSKLKTVVSEIGRSGFDHELQSSPILWTTSAVPQSSQFLSLLTNTQNPNPTTLSNSNPAVTVKEEMSLLGSPVINEPNARTLGFDLVNPLWKHNNQHQAQQINNNIVGGDVQNTGFSELYQRLKSSSSSSTSSYYSDSSSVILRNVASSSSILESTPVTGGDLGYWNPAFSSSWSDFPTTNGAYP